MKSSGAAASMALWIVVNAGVVAAQSKGSPKPSWSTTRVLLVTAAWAPGIWSQPIATIETSKRNGRTRIGSAPFEGVVGADNDPMCPLLKTSTVEGLSWEGSSQ